MVAKAQSMPDVKKEFRVAETPASLIRQLERVSVDLPDPLLSTDSSSRLGNSSDHAVSSVNDDKSAKRGKYKKQPK